MKVGIAFANVGPFTEPDNLAHLARCAEAAGIESLWTVEHVVVPIGYESEYPYDKSGKIPGGEVVAIPDPLLPLAYAAAVTDKIKLATGILILPQRHPAYVAKEVATLDVLSKGRAILGIGVGWLREEFAAVDVEFETRGSRTREAVAAIRSLWREEPEPFEGRFFNWGAVQSLPNPVQAGGVPIVMGGHTELAAKRAARYCDGFFPAKGKPDELEKLFGVLRGECKKVGRDPDEIEISLTAPGTDLDRIKAYADMGVSRVIMGPPGFTPEEIEKNLAALADSLISKL